jgi:hypothetical protein
VTENCLNLSPALNAFAAKREELIYKLSSHPRKNIHIWGCGLNGQMAARLLLESGMKVKSFYDRKASGNILGCPICNEPASLSSDQFIIIAMNRPQEAINRIIDMCNSSGAPWLHIINSDTEYDTLLLSQEKKLSEYQNIHRGKRCFVAGNGPSLNKIDMAKLKDEIVIGSNRCFIGFEKWGVQFPYWGVEDAEVGGWQAEGWKKLRGTIKFVPIDMASHIESDDSDVCLVNLQRIDFKTTPPLFSVYPHVLFTGRTVTYMLLQLAAIMGCSPIYLIGVDFHFTHKGTEEEKDGKIWRQKSNGDLNHFDPSYIPQGRFLNKPYWNLQKLAFESAKNASELYGFKIYNATPESKLEVFDKINYDSLF